MTFYCLVSCIKQSFIVLNAGLETTIRSRNNCDTRSRLKDRILEKPFDIFIKMVSINTIIQIMSSCIYILARITDI